MIEDKIIRLINTLDINKTASKDFSNKYTNENNEIGVIISPGYGSGLSTWNADAKNCEKDPYVINLLLILQEINVYRKSKGELSLPFGFLKEIDLKFFLSFLIYGVYEEYRYRDDCFDIQQLINIYNMDKSENESIEYSNYLNYKPEDFILYLFEKKFFVSRNQDNQSIVLFQTTDMQAQYFLVSYIGSLIEKHYNEKYEYFYFHRGNTKDLEIKWLKPSTFYTIDEYDGSESLRLKENSEWQCA